jgi:hypothetical protein
MKEIKNKAVDREEQAEKVGSLGYHDVIRKMYHAGYSVDPYGVIHSPFGGTLSTKPCGGQKYATMTCPKSVSGLATILSVPVHKFVAYSLYGDKAFSLHARHLDGNSSNNSPSNIKLGTAKENEADKCPLQRQRVARYARSCQGITPNNAKLSEEDVRFIREVCSNPKNRTTKSGRLNNGVIPYLRNKYSVSNVTINEVVRGRKYGHIK